MSGGSAPEARLPGRSGDSENHRPPVPPQSGGRDLPRRGQTAWVSDIPDALEDLAERLAGIAADMDDLGFEELRAAASGGDPRHLDTERRLLRARRAVGRAIAALRTPEGDGAASF